MSPSPPTKAILLRSGDHAGSHGLTPTAVVVSCVRPVPSAFMRQISNSGPPARRLVKAMCGQSTLKSTIVFAPEVTFADFDATEKQYPGRPLSVTVYAPAVRLSKP